jgi:hypothetical protein
MSQPKDISFANVMESVTQNGSKEVLKKFHWAIKKVANDDQSEGSEHLTQDELIELVRSWEPKRDILCLYVRWARQLKRNFNLDSIATLLCLSRQCEYTPLDFLRKVKMLSVYKNQQSLYGVAFQFDVPNRQDINKERLHKEFIGLSVTLALLQEQVTKAPSILGKTGMRQSGPRTAIPIHIPLDGTNMKTDTNATVVNHPTMEFHTQSSLLHRIWLSIKHRWLSLHITEHLFREPNASWLYQEALVYSFQMMSPCGPGRYEFLSPLAGYCLQFCTQESIDAKRSRLRSIWNDPSMFFSFGNTCLTHFSADAKSRIIIACFQDLCSEIPSNAKQISYHRDQSWHRRWLILRAYVFHFWLDSASNHSLKATVTNATNNASFGKKKRKLDCSVCDTKPPARHVNHISTRATIPSQLTRTNTSIPGGGLQSIISTRRPSSTSNGELQGSSIIDDKISKTCKNTTPQVSCMTTGRDWLIKDINWADFRLITLEELQQYVQSYLVIHRLDGIDLVSELSPLEVYSADHLHDLVHCRLTGNSPYFPRSGQVGAVVLQVHAEADSFVDTAAKSFHIAREQSGIFVEHAHCLPSMQAIKMLCQTISLHGTIDSKRATGQYRVNIGNGGQNWVEGAPCELHGLQFQKNIEKAGTHNVDEVLHTIGQLAEFTWKVMCSFQMESQDHPIAPDPFRRGLYASHLNKYLNMENEVGFEDLTLVVSSLHPIKHEVSEHKDTMNDTVAGYTRTGTFNLVMINDNDAQPHILHFQVICNFRKVIGRYVLPFHKFLLPVTRHAKEYLTKWHRSIHSVYAGKTDKVPSAYDRSSFFLDDTLNYSQIMISEEGKHKKSISSEYILTEVNISRTLSFSMFIDPLVILQHRFKFDQTIELAFACSFLSNPFWFDWTMSTLINRYNDPNDPFDFGLHPFYDWSHTTVEIFGTWQGGPHNRWSPCGGSKETVLETFGAHINATSQERKNGENKLAQVVSILYDHIEWINSLSNCGNTPVDDMPLPLLKAHCDRTIKEIGNIASCQFSHFRLAVLTTILTGSGLLKEGRHLRNLMYPVKGSASFKHLSSPVADVMSHHRARALVDNKTNEAISNDGLGVVKEEQHDLFMQYLSGELGFQVYVRDEIECILCESHPMRSLNCRDWFRKGISLYDCNEKGEYMQRKYGRNTEWVKLHPPENYAFAYLEKSPVAYIPLDAKLSHLAPTFGKELRMKNVVFKGRTSRTSGMQQAFTNSYSTSNETYSHPSIQMADFYLGSKAKKDRIRSMFVLGDAEHAVETSCCNNLEQYPTGKILHQYLRSLSISNPQLSSHVAAGCYHRDSDLNNEQVTYFPGHIDKQFVHTAWFVPVGSTPFFTIIAVSRGYHVSQDSSSLEHFNEWMARLTSSESQKVNRFLQSFDIQAKKSMRLESIDRLIYLNKCGSVLSFPANQCYHATITPKKPHGFPRDLFIFHPLDGLA